MENNENYSNKLKDEFSIIYISLKGYSIISNDILINNIEDFLLSYVNIDKWIIHDENNNLVDPLKIKKELEQLWDENISKLIENYFDTYIENRWNTFLNYVNTELINKKTWMVRPKLKEYFIEFISLQLCRRYENFKRFGLDFAVDFFLKFLKDSLPKNVTESADNAEIYKKDIILIELYRYVKKIYPNIISHTFDFINSEMQICFLVGDVGLVYKETPPQTTYEKNLMSMWESIKSGSWKKHLG